MNKSIPKEHIGIRQRVRGWVEYPKVRRRSLPLKHMEPMLGNQHRQTSIAIVSDQSVCHDYVSKEEPLTEQQKHGTQNVG